MKVINIHQRRINSPIEEVGLLLDDLATKNNKIWPYENWPAMRFKNGVRLNSKGGYGPIRYTITQYIPRVFIEFTFHQPKIK